MAIEDTQPLPMDVDSESSSSPCRLILHTLEDARSAVDLLAIIQDVILVLKHLFVEHQILHRHIDYNNIYIRSDGDNGMKGVVLDLDFPDPAEGSSRSAEGLGLYHSFTFQSVECLRDRRYTDSNPHEHTVHDDLESVFYALCWACYGYDHTGRPDRFRPDWMQQEQWRHASSAYSKRSSFRSVEISSHVNRYMGCQRDILEDIIDNFRRRLGHDSGDPEREFAMFLGIVEKGIEEVRDGQCGIALGCSKVTRSVFTTGTSKRKLCEVGGDDSRQGYNMNVE
ncbi:hypothetical protein B0H13DRAFT_2114639 [Mycena leptocephala]|nr:hypothetical protein B0H13DRAFT_2114639 [Mycena leptocephala]